MVLLKRSTLRIVSAERSSAIMAKVLKVNVSKTIIGLENGSFEEVDTSDCIS